MKERQSGDAVRQRVNLCLSKLSDRDTEAMAIAELDSLALSLPMESLPPFLSAISDSRPTDKTPLRRHPLRILSILSENRSSEELSPHIGRMLSAALRRLRDPDSSVRLALVDAVRSLAAAAAGGGGSAGVMMRPLAEAIIQEQEVGAQGGAAAALAAAIGAAPELGEQMHRLIPRFIKLLRSSAFKAKAALISVLGAAAAAGAAAAPAVMGQLVPCLVEFLGSEDWAARKAAADALAEVAAAEREMLGGFKNACLATFESRKFDKVKNVRDSMNQMIEAWKSIPEIADARSVAQSNSSPREATSNASLPSVKSASPIIGKKSRFVEIRSNPSPASRKNISPTGNNRSAKPRARPLFCKTDSSRNSEWTVDVSVLQTPPPVEEKAFEKGEEMGENKGNVRAKPEAKRMLFGKNGEDKVGKLAGLKATARVVPVIESASYKSTVDGGEGNASDKDGDLSVIRMQLVQIENQQSSLLELLQRFIGSSQNGIHSLETRVNGLEMALDEISRDMATSYGRFSNNDPADMSCCRLPGTEFLSSKFWRRAEGRYSSRHSISGDPTLSDTHNFAGKQGPQSYQWDTQRFGLQGGFVNPLAEHSSQSRGSTETPSKMLRNVTSSTGIRHTQDG